MPSPPIPLVGTNLAALVVPFTTADEFPTHDSQYGLGGWHEVESTAARDAIPAARLRPGTVANVYGTGLFQWTGSAWTAYSVSAPAFGVITSGTNNSASMVVGVGAALTVDGMGGIIEANELATTGAPVNVSGNAPSHAGQLLISQPGNTTAVWADPMVQGLFPTGTNVLTGNSGGPIYPVLVGAQNPSNLLENLNVDGGGNLYITGSVSVTGTVGVTQSTSPWGVSGTIAVSNFPSQLSEFTFTNYGSPAEEALNVYVVNPTSSSVTQGTSPWVVSGTVTANQGGAPWSVAFPSAQHVIVDSGSISISGTVGVTQSTSPWVTDDSNAVTQGSTTSGQSGFLSMGAVTTGAPTYANAQTSPLSLNTGGALRVAVTNTPISVAQSTNPWVTQDNADTAIGAVLPSVVEVVGGSDYGGTPHIQVLKVDSSGNLYVGNFPSSFAVTQSTSPWVISGTVTSNQGTNPWTTNIEASGVALTATNYGSPPVEALNVYVVNPVSSNVTLTPTPLTPSAPGFTTVGIASAQAVAANANRKGLVLVNISTNYVSLAFGGNAAVLYSGILLVPYGSFEMDEFTFTTQAVNAIASAGSTNLAIQEFSS